MLNWYAMGANAPSMIDEANERRKLARLGMDYAAHEVRKLKALANTSRSGTIRAWRLAA